MRLAGKVVVITGASQGIGAACAAEMARAGARLSVSGRCEDRLRQVAGDSLFTAGDITREEDRRLLVDRTLDRYGAIDVLINNAGVGAYSPSWAAPLDEVRAVMELNFFAALGL